jgi:hypothetical protein
VGLIICPARRIEILGYRTTLPADHVRRLQSHPLLEQWRHSAPPAMFFSPGSNTSFPSQPKPQTEFRAPSPETGAPDPNSYEMMKILAQAKEHGDRLLANQKDGRPPAAGTTASATPPAWLGQRTTQQQPRPETLLSPLGSQPTDIVHLPPVGGPEQALSPTIISRGAGAIAMRRDTDSLPPEHLQARKQRAWDEYARS